MSTRLQIRAIFLSCSFSKFASCEGDLLCLDHILLQLFSLDDVYKMCTRGEHFSGLHRAGLYDLYVAADGHMHANKGGRVAGSFFKNIVRNLQ